MPPLERTPSTPRIQMDELAPKTGSQAKVHYRAIHQACGGAVRLSGNDSGIRSPASSELRWKRLKAASRLVSCRVNIETHTNLMRVWKRHLPKDGPRVFYHHERPYQSPYYCTPAEEHFVLCSEPVASVWMYLISPIPWIKP